MKILKKKLKKYCPKCYWRLTEITYENGEKTILCETCGYFE